ncbi:oxygenase MpaB family protein [Pantoea sp. GL120224-02]|uniref:oxygenase MpaB family protein n=1 Tax=Pantoea sp. GL120224-02 TaxID=1378084 RepID=UPI000BD5A463|nr:oxygenase MpaB family protein [Pantoea sp. GL120224-02]SNY61239.1 hypothetical protein SAMN02744778_01037 [Pantoea sp. GL120224-02]
MNLRNRIQQQVFRLNGLALNEFDISQPLGDPGLFGPDHVIWRVHGDFPSMLCGGISALMLQMLHPAALAEQDRYYDEAALIAEALGAEKVPKTVQAVEDYLQAMRPELICDERTLEVMQLLINAPAPSWQAKPAMRVMLKAGMGLLPDWAQQQIQQPISPLTQWRVDKEIAVIAGLLRWSIQRGAYSRAMQRMGR